jgi:hypothetical protein
VCVGGCGWPWVGITIRIGAAALQLGGIYRANQRSSAAAVRTLQLANQRWADVNIAYSRLRSASADTKCGVWHLEISERCAEELMRTGGVLFVRNTFV